jgi:hypothetical protein
MVCIFSHLTAGLAPRGTTHEGDGSFAFNPLSPAEIDFNVRIGDT